MRGVGKEGALEGGRGGRGRVEQVNLCVETINISCGGGGGMWRGGPGAGGDGVRSH